MSDNLLALKGLGDPIVELSEDVESQRKQLLASATEITAVDDAFSAEIAAEFLRDSANLLKAVENSRKEIKEPVLKIGRAIDSCAKEFSSALESQKNRVSRLLGAFQAAERERQAKALREAQEAERKARYEAEAALRAAKTEQEEVEIKEKAIAATTVARTAIAETKAREPEGARLSKTLKWEVVDIKELFEKHPELCKIEPNAEMIRATIKFNRNIAGLRVWEDVKSVF